MFLVSRDHLCDAGKTWNVHEKSLCSAQGKGEQRESEMRAGTAAPSLHCSSDSYSHSDSSTLWARTRSPHRLMSLLRGQWRHCAPLSSACAKTVALTKNDPSPFEDGFRQQIINYS